MLENYIQENIKTEMVQIQATAVQNQTATMLEIGTNLLTRTAEQTRKLTDVEAQVEVITVQDLKHSLLVSYTHSSELSSYYTM
ncbi:UNVERIFIED_CONTAM: hypothetical protein FKN15_027407 [Acipenser sinensis]